MIGHALEGPGDRVTATRFAGRSVRVDAIRGLPIELPREIEKNTAARAVASLLNAVGADFGIALEIQTALGSDIVMVFDQCTTYPCTPEDSRVALERTVAWALRSRRAFDTRDALPGSDQALFGIVQGSVYPDQRVECAARLQEIGFDGYAIGGLAVGESKSAMWETVEVVEPHLPADRPRYLMGVGTPDDLVEGVRRGIDMFDCVMPTRNARKGTVFTRIRPGHATIQRRNRPGKPLPPPQYHRNLRQRDGQKSPAQRRQIASPQTGNQSYKRHQHKIKDGNDQQSRKGILG